jgi:hypothetical protein
MLRQALDRDHVAEIDSGPGDDKIMQMWFGQNRERAGLLIFNLRTMKGLVATVGHVAGGRALSVARRLRDLLRRLAARLRRAFPPAIATIEGGG